MSCALTPMRKQEILDIEDPDMGLEVCQPQKTDPTRDGIFAARDDSLANFFMRPIVAQTYTWTPGQVTPFNATLNPWTDFFNNPRVSNRINNYNVMSAKLHVDFMINGNGFYYGLLMADYCPLFTYDNVSETSPLVAGALVQASQRMKVFINPSGSCTTAMTLPFVWFKDAVPLPDIDLALLGQINIREVNALKHANASTQPVNITVLIRAEDVKLAAPTAVPYSGLTVQAGEEYSSGPISTPASAIANVASKFTMVPMIGQFATATSMMAQSTAAVAKMFGFSRPAMITDPQVMLPRYTTALAVTNVADAVNKLTMDVKNELTVDPNVVGVDLDDELSVASIAARESYLTQFTWATSAVPGTGLWHTRVGCNHVVGSAPIYVPALAFATLPFSYWRGKIRYRFQIVASAHHRGRLRIVWDPQRTSSTPELNVQYTKIVDIAENNDIIVDIDWGQPLHYCNISAWSTANYRTSAPFATSSAAFNGALSIYVLNDLATPNSTVNNDVSVNVYISCNDLEVAVPAASVNPVTDKYSVVVQAGEPVAEDSEVVDPGCDSAAPEMSFGDAQVDDHDALVYFGERVTSMRTLLKRYRHHMTLYIPNPSTTAKSLYSITLPNNPLLRGYNTRSYTLAATAKKYNYVHSGWEQYLSQAFLAKRGSHRSKYVVTGAADTVGSLTVQRVPSLMSPVPVVATTLATNQNQYAYNKTLTRFDGSGGMAVTVPSRQPILDVELPYYSNLRFQSARLVDYSSGNEENPFRACHTVEVEMDPGTRPVTIDRYVATGEDYNLVWFQGCPPMYTVSVPAP